jgi:transcriptional regulator with XRE-family HTH domain
MTACDGPTLRAVRENMGVPLRRIARQAGMSHGHLSKVERGEYGRPVTPAIMAAYERVTGVRLADAVAAVTQRDADAAAGEPPGGTWHSGQLTDLRRRGYNAAVAALAIGGHLGEPFGRLLDATGRPLTPAPPDPVDASQLARVAELVTELDLQHGGGLVSQLAKALLRWAVAMLDTSVSEPVGGPLHAAVGALAHRAAWSAFDVAAHEAARSLFRLALYAAVRAADPQLRAHVLADVAAQHNQLGYHQDSLEIVRIAEGDERVAPAVRMVLHGVKARGYAAIGEATACRRHVGLAEEAFAAATPDGPGWVGGLCDPAHLYATTGHAMAELARNTGDAADLREARERLTEAIDAFDWRTHGRTHALCTSQLALLYVGEGELEPGVHWARQALRCAAGIRSARVAGILLAIGAAAARSGDPRMRELVGEIDAAVSGSAE